MKNITRSAINKLSFLTIFLFLLFSLLTKNVNAQSLWLMDTTKRAVHVELMKPFFENAENISFFSMSEIVSSKFKVNDKFSIVTEFPFATFDSEFSDFEFAYGNPYLGLMYGNKSRSYFFEGGLRLPLAKNENFSALTVGLVSDYDRLEAFSPELFSIILSNNFRKKYSSNYLLTGMAGFTFLIPRGDNNRDNDGLFDYSIHTGYDGAKVQLLGGITGRLIFTGEGADLNERNINHFTASGRYKAGKIQPGLMLRIPMDEELRDFYNLIMGVNLTINFN